MPGSGEVSVIQTKSSPASPWRETLTASGVLDLLAHFDPRIAGTLPLGVSLAGSDIDILCHAPDPDDVAEHLWRWRERLPALSLRRWTTGHRPLVATFTIGDWPAEVFASPIEVDAQEGWRHFIAEQRLLELAGDPLRARVLTLRRGGARTEPAFATALGLSGDPYVELYTLSQASDEELHAVLMSAGFTPGGSSGTAQLAGGSGKI